MSAAAEKARRVINGAMRFGVRLRLDGDTLDSHYEPADTLIARIKEHKSAIVSLLRRHRASSRLDYDKAADLTRSEIGEFESAMAASIANQQASLEALQAAAALGSPGHGCKPVTDVARGRTAPFNAAMEPAA